MNTLNYKALFVRTGLLVFIRAIGIYLLMTIPALGVPVMYLISGSYVISFGWIAAAIFLLVLLFLQRIQTAGPVKTVLLYAAVPAAVAVAFQMMEVLGVEHNIWQSGLFLIFPGAAVVSGWLSLVISKRSIKKLFGPVNSGYYTTTGNQDIFSDNTPVNNAS